MSKLPNHPFLQPGTSDSRAPCPALNALANHGYLPRSGQNITIFQLVHALRTVYNLSLPLAIVLAVGGLLLCGHGILHYYLDLADLAAHNKIEHDASLAHADAPPHSHWAPIGVDKDLLKHLLEYAADNHGLTLSDFTKARVDRERRLLQPLGSFHAQIACGEAALTWLLMKDRVGEVPLLRLSEWWGEERLPPDWQRPQRAIGLLETRAKAVEVAEAMKKLNAHANE